MTHARPPRDPAAWRQAELAKIHLARRDLGLDDPTYRAQISRISDGRTDSAGALTDTERRRLLDEYRAAGWRGRPPAGVRRTRPAATKAELVSKVRALLADAGRPDAYADRIAEHAFGIERWEWLDWDQTLKLTQMLVIDQQRRARRAAK